MKKQVLLLSSVVFVVGIIYMMSQEEGADSYFSVFTNSTKRTVVEKLSPEELILSKALQQQIADTEFELPDLSLVADDVKLITGAELKSGEVQNYGKGTAAVHKFGNAKHLKAADYQALNSFIVSHPSEEEKNSLWLHSLKNDIIVFMVERDRRTDNEDALQAMFVKVLKDKKQSVVLKDYVVQYVPALFERLYPEGEELTEELAFRKKEIEKALWGALESKEGSIAGTALLKLDELSQTYNSISKSKVLDHAVKIAMDGSYTSAARFSAFDMVAVSDHKEAKKFVRDMIFSKDVGTSLKYKAIAASSRQGSDPELLAYLEKEILNNPDRSKLDKRLVWAAEAAQKRLK